MSHMNSDADAQARWWSRRIRYEGERLPPWYFGLTSVESFSGYFVFHPVPLNYGLRAWRWWAARWHRLRGTPGRDDLRVRRLVAAHLAASYEAGFLAGQERGMELANAMLRAARERALHDA